jgi:hypothetical protein
MPRPRTDRPPTAANFKGGKEDRRPDASATPLGRNAMRRAIANWVYEGGAGGDVK